MDTPGKHLHLHLGVQTRLKDLLICRFQYTQGVQEQAPHGYQGPTAINIPFNVFISMGILPKGNQKWLHRVFPLEGQ